MDILARTGYQMGKSPVLPVLALAVGAGSAELGLIAAASVATGILLKPWVGALSDRIGRRFLLLTAGALFALVPGCYVFVDGFHSLMAVRILHGMATAVCGPIMAALVADLFSDRRQGCRRFGWYDAFRSVGYVSGPLLGGLAIKAVADPRFVYLAVGMFGLGAAGAALFVAPPSGTSATSKAARQRPIWTTVAHFARELAGSPHLRGIVGIELIANMMTRWIKVFWVVWAVDRFDLAFIGGLISLMFAASLCIKPVTGWLGSRTAPGIVLSAGAVLIAAGVVGLYQAHSPAGCLFWAMLTGIGDGLVMPSVLALVAYTVDSRHRGTAFGVLGSCRNIGKAAGPALGGLLVATCGAPWTAAAAACLLLVLAGRLFWYSTERSKLNRPLDSALTG